MPDEHTGRQLRAFFLTVLDAKHLNDWHAVQDEGDEAMRDFLQGFRIRFEQDGELVESNLDEEARELLVTGTLAQIEQTIRLVEGSQKAKVILAVFPPYD